MRYRMARSISWRTLSGELAAEAADGSAMLTLWWLVRQLLGALLALAVLSALLLIYVRTQDNSLDLLISPDASTADIARATAALGENLPIWQQYPMFLHGLLDGRLGRSFAYNAPAMRLVLGRMPASLELVVISMALALLIGLPLGRALRSGQTRLGRAVSAFVVLGLSMPVFWLGLVLLAMFAVQLDLLPTAGRGETALLGGVSWSFLTLDGLRHLALPVATLAIGNLALVLRLVQRQKILRVLSVSFVELGHLLAGAVVIETIFAWPGIGKLTTDSINVLDRPVILATLVLVVSVVYALNLIVALLERMFAAADDVALPPLTLADNLLAGLGGLGWAMLIMLAIAAAYLAQQNPYEPSSFNIADANLPPYAMSRDGLRYWLGTDDQGRDVLSAILYGLRISLLIGAGSVLAAWLLGATLGSVAAFAGGAVEAVIGWVGAVQLALPAILVTLLVLAFTTRRISYVMLALVLQQWPRHAIIAHQAIALDDREGRWWVALKSFSALSLTQLASAMALEATLSFLGLGLPTTMPSLGVLIANGVDALLNGRSWVSFWPGLALLGLVMTTNLVAWRVQAASTE